MLLCSVVESQLISFPRMSWASSGHRLFHMLHQPFIHCSCVSCHHWHLRTLWGPATDGCKHRMRRQSKIRKYAKMLHADLHLTCCRLKLLDEDTGNAKTGTTAMLHSRWLITILKKPSSSVYHGDKESEKHPSTGRVLIRFNCKVSFCKMWPGLSLTDQTLSRSVQTDPGKMRRM